MPEFQLDALASSIAEIIILLGVIASTINGFINRKRLKKLERGVNGALDDLRTAESGVAHAAGVVQGRHEQAAYQQAKDDRDAASRPRPGLR